MVIHTSQTPLALDNNNGQQITLGTGFQLNVSSKTCYGVRFWAPSTNSGTYTALLYVATAQDSTGTGTELARKAIASTSITAGTWNVILFDTPVVMSNANSYKAAIHTSSGRYPSRASVFSGASITGDDITLYANGADPVGLGTMFNGVFRDNALNYPATTFSQNDYYVEPWVTPGALSGNLNRVTVTDSARTVARTKSKAANRVSTTETARAVTLAKSRLLNRVSEVTSARAAARQKSVQAARVTVTEAARSLGRIKTPVALTRVTETAAARSLGNALKAYALGRVAETATARTLSVSGSKTANLVQVSVTETARTLGKAKANTLARTLSIDTARTLAVSKVRGVNRVATTEAARPLSAFKVRPLGRVSETASARSASAAKRKAINRALEIATARTLTATGPGPEPGFTGQIWGVDMGLR